MKTPTWTPKWNVSNADCGGELAQDESREHDPEHVSSLSGFARERPGTNRRNARSTALRSGG
jgi:hypothetical protein